MQVVKNLLVKFKAFIFSIIKMRTVLLLQPFRLILLIFVFLLHANLALAQASFKVLHFNRTSGFDHSTRDVSLRMFQELGGENGFEVVNDPDGSSFNSLTSLQQYSVVVFSNTSGDEILNTTQRANFESYMNGGGSFVGIHAASDTYRHSTANGNNTGIWDWYAVMLGASVQENPNHVAGTPSYTMTKVGTHPSTQNLPNPWTKEEEYYYWQNGYFNAANQTVLQVEQTRGPNNQVNGYDEQRPMSWYKVLPSGGKSFYTALGHAPENYTMDQDFRKHIRDAVLWAGTVTTSTRKAAETEEILHINNPVKSILNIELQDKINSAVNIDIITLSGQVVKSKRSNFVNFGLSDKIDLSGTTAGMYILKLEYGQKIVTRKFFLIE